MVVDTSAWIEWLTATPLAEEIGNRLPTRDAIIVPTIVQLELAKWATRERGDDVSDEIIAYTMKCHVVDLDISSALIAADICRRHGLATADAIVYGAALQHDAGLLTCDAHFERLPGVIYIAKPKG